MNSCNTEGVGLISDSISKVLAKNYEIEMNRFMELSNNRNSEEIYSKSAWFSYEEIKKYLCILENEYQNLPDSLKTKSTTFGIRVYFGKYPSEVDMRKSSDLKDIPERLDSINIKKSKNMEAKIDYSGKHCLFFVPTFECIDGNGEKYHQDFRLSDYSSSKPISEKILLIGINKNHGGLAPPERIDGADYLENTGQ